MHPSTWKGHLPFLVVATSTWQTSSPRGLRIISKSMSTSPTTPQKSNIDTNICHMFQGSYLIQPIILGVYIYIQPLVFRGFSNPQPVLPLWPDDLLLWRDMITEDHGWGADNDGVLGNRGCVAKQKIDELHSQCKVYTLPRDPITFSEWQWNLNTFRRRWLYTALIIWQGNGILRA